MGREIDKRNLDYRVPDPAGALESFAAERTFDFEGIGEEGELARTARIDAFTGSISRIELDGADSRGFESPREYALELARNASRGSPAFAVAIETFGREAEAPDFALSPTIAVTSGEARVVHMDQYHKGIPVFLSGRTVQLRPDKTVITGTTVDMLGAAETEPVLAVEAALQLAAKYVADGDEGEANAEGWGDGSVPPLELQGFAPRVIASFELPMMPTVFEGRPFEEMITASLVYFYQGPDVRLAWSVGLVFPDGAADYNILVAAGPKETGEILYAKNRLCNLIGRCDLHRHNPKEANKLATSMPLPAVDFPAPIAPVSPRQDWVTVAATSGNNVVTVDENGKILAGAQAGDDVSFSPAGTIEDATAHTFYFCNVIHCFFEALGFDEVSGNFQAAHNGSAPGAGDPVNAIVYDQAFGGVASMRTPPDGQSPTMRMGRWQNSNRHSGLDSDVVFHEFVHGVTNRLVGGRLNNMALQEPQSRGMGEGWSDYFALSFQNAMRTTEKVVSGDYITGDPAGIRSHPYDDHYPNGYGDIAGMTSVHRIGEVWCAALMMSTRKAIAALGDKARGHALCWQIVVDGLKLAPPNPSFLDARDAILDALEDLASQGTVPAAEKDQLRRACWEAFAHFGMGTGARTNGARLSGIVADHGVPADL